MPWTAKQNALFRAAAHNPKVAASSGIPQGKAKQMASEGVKKAPPKQQPKKPAPKKAPPQRSTLRQDLENAMDKGTKADRMEDAMD